MQQISTDMTPTLYWVIAIAAMCTMIFCVVFLRYREDTDENERLPDDGNTIHDNVDMSLTEGATKTNIKRNKPQMVTPIPPPPVKRSVTGMWTDEDMLQFANHCVQRYRTLGYIKAKKKTLHEWLIKNAST